MAARNITDIYMNFRNISIHSKSSGSVDYGFLHSKGKSKQPDDTVALVQNSSDVELGIDPEGIASLPPEWIDAVDEVQYETSKIKQKMRELSTLHDKHLNRPTLDDNIDEEHTIEIMTQEITQMFHQCQRSIQKIQGKAKTCGNAERRVIKNVVSSLASMVQELSQTFKRGQSIYLKRLKSREEREKQYFDSGMTVAIGDSLVTSEIAEELYDKGFTTGQLQLVEENTELIAEREQEIQHIVRSIVDLNEIFKDLSVMIIDQGTILDRIDYNVEQASTQVEKGLQQLQKGEKYQKSSRKMLCIIVLALALIIMLIALVITKGKK